MTQRLYASVVWVLLVVVQVYLVVDERRLSVLIGIVGWLGGIVTTIIIYQLLTEPREDILR